MEPVTFMYIASGVLSSWKYRTLGRMARLEAARTAERLKQEAKQRELRQLQEHNEIMQNFRTMKSTNIGLTGISGRDMGGADRSFKRIIEKAKENAYLTASRSNLQNIMDQGKIAQQSQMVELQGRNKSKAYRMMGFQSILNTAYGASKVSKPDDPSGSTSWGYM